MRSALSGTLTLMAAVFAASTVYAGVNVNIGIPVPAPVVVVPSPPPPPAVVYPAQQPAMPVEQAPAPQDSYGYAETAPPPQLEFAQPPDMAVVPSGQASVYVIPNTFGVYFYGNSWYRYYNGLWFQAGAYNDPWVPYVGVVPQVILGVPPEYPLVLPPNYYRFHYGEFRSHWRDWDRNRYWQRQGWYRNEMRGEIRRGRLNQITRERERWGRGEGHRPQGFGRHDPGHRGPGAEGRRPGAEGRRPGAEGRRPGAQQGQKPGGQHPGGQMKGGQPGGQHHGGGGEPK